MSLSRTWPGRSKNAHSGQVQILLMVLMPLGRQGQDKSHNTYTLFSRRSGPQPDDMRAWSLDIQNMDHTCIMLSKYSSAVHSSNHSDHPTHPSTTCLWPLYDPLKISKKPSATVKHQLHLPVLSSYILYIPLHYAKA